MAAPVVVAVLVKAYEDWSEKQKNQKAQAWQDDVSAKLDAVIQQLATIYGAILALPGAINSDALMRANDEATNAIKSCAVMLNVVAHVNAGGRTDSVTDGLLTTIIADTQRLGTFLAVYENYRFSPYPTVFLSAVTCGAAAQLAGSFNQAEVQALLAPFVQYFSKIIDVNVNDSFAYSAASYSSQASSLRGLIEAHRAGHIGKFKGGYACFDLDGALSHESAAPLYDFGVKGGLRPSGIVGEGIYEVTNVVGERMFRHFEKIPDTNELAPDPAARADYILLKYIRDRVEPWKTADTNAQDFSNELEAAKGMYAALIKLPSL